MSSFFSKAIDKAAASTSDAVTGVTVEWLLSQIHQQRSKLSSCEKPISRLRRTRKRIQCVLLDAEERRHIEDEAVKNWLSELRIATLDADDVLDRYDTLHKLRDKVKLLETSNSRNQSDNDDENPSSAKRPRVSSASYPYSFLMSFFTQLKQTTQFNEDIDRIEKRLDEIAEGKKRYRLDAGDGRRRGNTRKVTHTGPPSVESYVSGSVVGREKEKMIVVSQLFSQEAGLQHRPSIIPIWGAAGVGKTTLAQLVLDDVEVKNFFDLCVWVSVPEGCDVARITKEIIEAIRRRRAESVSFNVLQEQLRRLLNNKKFLLVLDNLWVTGYNFWDNLQLSLQEGSEGSKVLVTCRSKDVFRGMPVVRDPINLKGLEETYCWELLRRHAFSEMDWDDYSELEKIGRDIVKKCGGSPLAAKSLGSVLYGETDEDYWSSLRNEMWALEKEEDPVLVSLMISYHHLSYELKRCFVYCSVFPDGYKFDKDELVRLWIAEGLVLPSGYRRLETIGGKFFDDLCWRSFFEMPNKEEQNYKMPSLMLKLARILSKSESLILENNELKVESECPKDLRCASIIHREFKLLELQKLYEYKNLRTVAIFGGDSRVSLWTVPPDLSDHLRCIRVLNLSNTEVEKLPDSVGDLIHLRYLGLSNTKMKLLPDAVCNLYNLQTIDLSECYDFRKLPTETSNLVNLRHIVLSLDWKKITVMECMPRRIGSITSLETLSRFTVTKVGNNGSNIGELKELTLRKELCLSNLEGVANAKDAEEVNLTKKQYIEKLLLQWSEHMIPTNRSNFEEVAKALCPQPRLKILCFKDYPGLKFPDWLGNERLKFLETLTLTGCKKCVVFPTLREVSQLKNLHVENMDNLVSMGEALQFPAMETLTVVNMPNLESWFEAKADNLFPKLKKLEVENCPKLTELNHLPSDLKPIIINCDSLVCFPASSDQNVVTDMIIG